MFGVNGSLFINTGCELLVEVRPARGCAGFACLCLVAEKVKLGIASASVHKPLFHGDLPCEPVKRLGKNIRQHGRRQSEPFVIKVQTTLKYSHKTGD